MSLRHWPYGRNAACQWPPRRKYQRYCSAESRGALQFAEQATREPVRVSSEFMAQLRQHFDEGEVLEIAAVVGLMNFANKVNESLAIPLEEKFVPFSATQSAA